MDRLLISREMDRQIDNVCMYVCMYVCMDGWIDRNEETILLSYY